MKETSLKNVRKAIRWHLDRNDPDTALDVLYRHRRRGHEVLNRMTKEEIVKMFLFLANQPDLYGKDFVKNHTKNWFIIWTMNRLIQSVKIA